jgi:hypothetical protein
MSRKHNKGRMAPFVPAYRLTLKHPAWKALSFGARSTYQALMGNYNTRMENAVYLSARKGAEELGCNKASVAKWMRELEHYGFTVMVTPGSLGVHGNGKAPHWRLTEMPYAGAAPTRDFMNWQGELFDRKKQNPVRRKRTPRTTKAYIHDRPGTPIARGECTTKAYIGTDHECTTEAYITSSTTPKLVWSAPKLTEVFGVEARAIRRAIERAEFTPMPRDSAPMLKSVLH